MNHLETALQKATDGNLDEHERNISKDLVRVYQTIALRFQDERDFDKSLEYFQKCLDASKRAQDKIMEAECYQKIGKIYEKLNDLDQAIEFLKRFLDICAASGNKQKAGEAHKQLAEAYSKNNNVQLAIKHLESLLSIANELKNKPAQADAFLKLGLLWYQEGKVKNSVDCLQKHFELSRADTEENKNQKLIDRARVNLGIAQANIQIEDYKKTVLGDLQGLLEWKIRRTPFKK